MRMKWKSTASLLLGLVAFSASACLAQTDVAASLYGAFSTSSNGNNTYQSPSNAAGGLLEVRHIKNPIIGYEATYAFNRADQRYSFGAIPVAVCNPAVPTCVPETTWAAISANAHEITGDWIASFKVRKLRAFALAGGGIILNVPVSTALGPAYATSGAAPGFATNNSYKPVFVYGAGVDWKLVPHVGLRFQYRGNLYKAPDLTVLFTSTSAFAHTAEPMIGVYFQF